MNPLTPKTQRLLACFVALLACVACVLLSWPLAPEGPTRSWSSLLAPLKPGDAVVGDYLLSTPAHAEEQGILLVARRSSPPAVVEVHIVPKGLWEGVRNTRSFGIAYEVPRSTAPEADCLAVTKRLGDLLEAHDPGGLTIQEIPLEQAGPSATVLRVLARWQGLRGALVAALFALALFALAYASPGPWLAGVTALALVFLGHWLRVQKLDLPFLHDQDIQRVRFALPPLSTILGPQFTVDRVPALYFVLLHPFVHTGSSAAHLRLFSVLSATALAALFALGSAQNWKTPSERAHTLLALAVLACSPTLLAHAREISPLLPVALLFLWNSLHAHALHKNPERPPSAPRLFALGLGSVLALYLYYLSIAFVLPLWLFVLFAQRRRSTVFAALLTLLLALPALRAAVVVFAQDLPARRTAELLPHLAWGAGRSPVVMLRDLAALLLGSLGAPSLLALVAALFWVRKTRFYAAVLPAVVYILVQVLLSLVARIQPYYVVPVAPVLLWALVEASKLEHRAFRPLLGLTLTASLCVQVPALASARNALYEANSAAFGPSFAARIRPQDSRPILVTEAHYDATLMAWYLSNEQGLWREVPTEQAQGALEGDTWKVLFLQRSHHDVDPSGERARGQLETLRASGQSFFLLDRTDFELPGVSGFLSRCRLLETRATAQLWFCEAPRRAGP